MARKAKKAAGAMPARPDEPRVRGPTLASQTSVSDAFEQTRLLIIAASNLAAMDDTPGSALHAVICAAEEKFEIAFDWYETRHKVN